MTGPEGVDRVSLSVESVLMVVGDSRQLTATALSASGATLAGRSVSWTSGNPAVATVGAATGLLTAVGHGTTTLTASVEGKSAQLAVEVVLPRHLLTVTTSGAGNGTVSSVPAGINCTRAAGVETGSCSQSVIAGTTVNLTAQGAGSHVFTGWSGAGCVGTATCQVTMSQAHAVVASFLPPVGSLTITITGLPSGAEPAVTIIRTGSPAIPVVSTPATFSGLAAGTWTINAGAVVHGGTTYMPNPTSQGVAITIGGTTTAAVAYSPQALNLWVESAYITQAIQTLSHSVELVSGRSAYLRVFGRANQANSALPRVRAKIWHGNTEVWGTFISASASGVTQSVNEGNLLTSWNFPLPEGLVRPGMRLLVDIDPDGAVAESNEGDNQFPRNGSPLPLAVRAVPQINVRLVPIRTVDGRIGDVDQGNSESYLLDMRRVLPLHDWGQSLRGHLPTQGGSLQPNDENGAWGRVLSELQFLKQVEGFPPSWYYLGVVKLGYSNGTNGIGYVAPSPADYSARVALVSDHPTDRGMIYAHELGHNMGRQHAPSQGARDPDPGYPFADARTGIWGIHPVTLQAFSPTGSYDIMGYDRPKWVSAYTWNAILRWREAPGAAPAASASGPHRGPEDGLVVWGRSTPGGLILEPAFRAAPSGEPLPNRGEWRIEGWDAAGRLLFVQRFDPVEVADRSGRPEHHFAMVLPLGAAVADQVTTLRVSGPEGRTERRTPPPSVRRVQDPMGRRVAAGRQQFTWDANRYPAALVRNAATGEVLGIARGGVADLWTNAVDLEIQLSDGVRVVRRRVAVQ